MIRPGIDAVSPLPDKFVGVAGTITTLYALKIGLAVYDPDRIQGGWLSRDEVEKQLYTLNALSVEEPPQAARNARTPRGDNRLRRGHIGQLPAHGGA